MNTGSTLPARVAAVVLVLVGAVAIVGPWIMPHDPDSGVMIDALRSPSGSYWLGTDYLGRDVLSRVIAGARVAALAGVEATTVAVVLGAGLGMVIGLAGGWLDRIVMRAIDGVSAIPAIVLAIAIIAALGTGLTRSMFAVGVAFAMSMARLARGLTLSERERLYVDGARVAGGSRIRLLRHHIAPNIAGPIAVQATLVFASAITIEAGLSYLGLGVQPPGASWGSMLSSAQRTIREAPFQAIPPGLAIVVTVLSINVMGDALVQRRRGASYDHPSGYLEPVTVQREAMTKEPGDDVPHALFNATGVTIGYGVQTAVDSVSLDIAPGEVVALVGESGSGKTSLAMAAAGLLTPPATVTAGAISLRTTDGDMEIVGAGTAGQRAWRSRIGVVFQEPSASLNPLQPVGRQLRDVLDARAGRLGATDDDVQRLLTDVGLPRPQDVARLRPGQISGGMAQRVMIALALAKDPILLVADEPTTALDVTVQAEIIGLLRRLCRERHFGVLLVTHDLGVAGELADRCHVMYQGRIVESGSIQELATRPKHPYTSALVSAVPQNEPGRSILDVPVASAPPPGTLGSEHGGCAYLTRCPHATDDCAASAPVPVVVADGRTTTGDGDDRDPQVRRLVACHHHADLDLAGAAPAPEGRTIR